MSFEQVFHESFESLELVRLDISDKLTAEAADKLDEDIELVSDEEL